MSYAGKEAKEAKREPFERDAPSHALANSKTEWEIAKNVCARTLCKGTEGLGNGTVGVHDPQTPIDWQRVVFCSCFNLYNWPIMVEKDRFAYGHGRGGDHHITYNVKEGGIIYACKEHMKWFQEERAKAVVFDLQGIMAKLNTLEIGIKHLVGESDKAAIAAMPDLPKS